MKIFTKKEKKEKANKKKKKRKKETKHKTTSSLDSLQIRFPWAINHYAQCCDCCPLEVLKDP
jgi:hypothetical protein